MAPAGNVPIKCPACEHYLYVPIVMTAGEINPVEHTLDVKIRLDEEAWSLAVDRHIAEFHN